MKLIGHAAIFNSRSVDLGGFREIIAPGAFTRTLSDGHPIFAVHHHNMAGVLGSTRSGTLKLDQDQTGLYFELMLPGTSLGQSIHELVRRGDLSSMSFSFRINGTAGEEWAETSNGTIQRTLKDISLQEISTVALPAYPASTVAARSVTPVEPMPDNVVPLQNHDNYALRARNRMMKRVMAAKLAVA